MKRKLLITSSLCINFQTVLTNNPMPTTSGMTCPVDLTSYTPEIEFHFRVSSTASVEKMKMTRPSPAAPLIAVRTCLVETC